MNKKVAGVVLAVFLASFFVFVFVQFHRDYSDRECGILLAFDDYNAISWADHFDLFDAYDVKATFFINSYTPTDFCFEAIDRGHEIGFHTASHTDVTELTEEELLDQVIYPIEAFRSQGIELTTFAYPYGSYTEELNERLLRYFKVLRGAYACEVVDREQMRGGFAESFSIDNGNYRSDWDYKRRINILLWELVHNKNSVVGLYSHAIGDGDWCVGEERLEYLFRRANEMGIRFYTYQELQ